MGNDERMADYYGAELDEWLALPAFMKPQDDRLAAKAPAIPYARAVTWHNAHERMTVWARKVADGPWHEATVIEVGRTRVRIQFATGCKAHRPYGALALRREKANGADRPPETPENR